MTLLTLEQFTTHFQIKNNTLILSPQIAMIANLRGYDKFTYISPNDQSKPNSQYETVLIDVLENDKFQNSGSSHAFRWFKHSLQYLKSNGVLIGKFPSYLTSKLIDLDKKQYQVETINLYEDYCCLKIIKTPKTKTTQVVYCNGEQMNVDVNKDIILHHYNEKFYSYINSVDVSTSCSRTTIDGKGEKMGDQLLKRTDRRDFDNLLFVPSNGNRPKAYVYDEVKEKNIGGDAFFAESVQQRNQFIEILKNSQVIHLVKEICYNNYTSMKLDHKKYILNEQVFSFANS
jgi:hypothetical protein